MMCPFPLQKLRRTEEFCVHHENAIIITQSRRRRLLFKLTWNWFPLSLSIIMNTKCPWSGGQAGKQTDRQRDGESYSVTRIRFLSLSLSLFTSTRNEYDDEQFFPCEPDVELSSLPSSSSSPEHPQLNHVCLSVSTETSWRGLLTHPVSCCCPEWNGIIIRNGD